MSTIFFFGKTKFFEKFFYHNTIPIGFYWIWTYIWSISLCKLTHLQESEMRPAGWTLSYVKWQILNKWMMPSDKANFFLQTKNRLTISGVCCGASRGRVSPQRGYPVYFWIKLPHIMIVNYSPHFSDPGPEKTPNSDAKTRENKTSVQMSFLVFEMVSPESKSLCNLPLLRTVLHMQQGGFETPMFSITSPLFSAYLQRKN